MDNFNLGSLAWFGIVVVIFSLLTIIGQFREKYPSNQYDERQIIGRGQAYKRAFFALLVYNVVYACVDSGGITWCEPGVGMVIGIFWSVTIFAITAISKDAFGGIYTKPRSIILLFLLIIVVQSICFVAECMEGNLIENGILTINFISLFNAICFAVILAVYLIYNRKAKLLEESGESNEES